MLRTMTMTTSKLSYLLLIGADAKFSHASSEAAFVKSREERAASGIAPMGLKGAAPTSMMGPRIGG